MLDAILAQDPNAHVACECAAKTGFLMIFGEASGNFDVDYEAIARKVICDIGYDSEDACFDGNTCRIIVHMEEQSADIAMGVNKSYEEKAGIESDEFSHIGAGDQGMMFGYANSETEELMPLSVKLAHVLALRLTEVRKNGMLPYLRPDGKTQVTVEYDDGKITRIDTIVVSTQHSEEVTLEQLRADIRANVIAPVVPAELIDEKTKYYINPTGRFVIGGAAYAARYVAKNIVAAGLATECEVQLAYAIGVAQPVSVCVDTFGTGRLDEEQLSGLVKDHFDMRPAAIIRKLELNKPQYRELAAYGQMGRTALGVKWEETDKADELRRAAGCC